MRQRKAVGVIEGMTTVEGFSVSVEGEAIGAKEYVEVDHENRVFLCLVKEAQRVAGKLRVNCVVVGQGPRTPFMEGAQVYQACELTVKQALELMGTEGTGIYIGTLKGFRYKVWLPVKKIGRVFIVGKPGSGKSYTVGVVVEEFLKKGLPVVIIDAHGEYSSLKVAGDPPLEGFGVKPRSYLDQVVEFADLRVNPGADISLDVLKAAQPEDLVVPAQCTIVNLRGLPDEEQLPVVGEVLETLFQASVTGRVKPFYCILDEAHRFAGKERTATTLLVKRFAQEGRKFGANLIVVTQRPQLLDTTVRGLVGTWVIHRVTDPNDVKIVMESGGLGHEWERDITWLEKGEALITGELVEKVPIIVNVRPRETKHGAPGFNPLDFVEPETRERIAKRVSESRSRLQLREAEVVEEQPLLAPGLPQCFLPIRITEESLRKEIHSFLPEVRVEVTSPRLEYYPALQYNVEAKVEREKPRVNYEDRLTGLVSLADGSHRIKWRSDTLYQLSLAEIEGILPQSKPPAVGRYVRIGIQLSQAKDVEKLLDNLKAYAALNLTKVVLYYKSLSRFTLNGDEEAFRRECLEAINGLREKEENDVRVRFGKEVERHNQLIQEGNLRIGALVKSVKAANEEMDALNEDVRKARKLGKPAKRLMMRISSMEKRIEKMRKDVEKATEEVKRHAGSREKTLMDMDESLASVEKRYEEMEKEEIGSQVIQPTLKELMPSVFQVVWIPVFKTQLSLGLRGRLKTLDIAWNAVNGKGDYGTCDVCHREVHGLTAKWLCTLCLSPLCSEHAKTCGQCLRTVCPAHLWECDACKRSLCQLEPRSECDRCHIELCAECVRKCIVCGLEKPYCGDHAPECQFCGQHLCMSHIGSHLMKCAACSGETCLNTVKHCVTCAKPLCLNCVHQCGSCGNFVCKDHSWVCHVCKRVLCCSEIRSTCPLCGKEVCGEDTVVCASCGTSLCKTHLVVCPKCKRQVCPRCLTSYRRFFIKREGCRLCVKPS